MKKDNIGQIYLVGDLLKKSSAILRKMESDELRSMGLNVYSAQEDKSINDKTAHTVESNNRLHERIVTKDTTAIMESDTIVAGLDESSIGSICEIGQIEMFNRIWDMLDEMMVNSNNLGHFGEMVADFMYNYPRKKVFVHIDDIRCTNIPEVGLNRSYYVNQYLRGICVSAMNRAGACASDDDVQDIMTWEEVIEKLKELQSK